jgi:precorrin-6B methylase 2
MIEPKINEIAGVFEIHPMEADAFCEHLSTHGIVCDGRGSQLDQWIEAPEQNVRQPDRVYVHVAQPERLREILKLYRSWRGSAVGAAGPASPLA